MAIAILRGFRESPRRVRVVAGMVRGKNVGDALTILTLQNRKAAAAIKKVLTSAIANASENDKADADKLFVKTITVDGAAMTHRWLPRSQGRANRINRRASHITIEVDVPGSVD